MSSTLTAFPITTSQGQTARTRQRTAQPHLRGAAAGDSPIMNWPHVVGHVFVPELVLAGSCARWEPGRLAPVRAVMSHNFGAS